LPDFGRNYDAPSGAVGSPVEHAGVARPPATPIRPVGHEQSFGHNGLTEPLRYPSDSVFAESPAVYASQPAVPVDPLDARPLPLDDFNNGPSRDARFDRPATSPRNLESGFQDTRDGQGIGPNLYGPSNFENSIRIPNSTARIKIGGYVKADLIYDFNPIDSTDLFDTTTIPVDAPHRTNTRFHARQSRLNFDTRWPTRRGAARVFVEADFFSGGDRWRLRHAYGEVGGLIAGQTWSTFTDMASLPETLDFEGAVSSIGRRQAQVRWTQPTAWDGVTVAAALEDPRIILELPDNLTGEPRTPTPDFIARVRITRPIGQFQIAGLFRELGFQPSGAGVPNEVFIKPAWGLHFTGTLQPNPRDRVYYEILFGDGIGSYKELPDAAPIAPFRLAPLPVFGWMIGWTHDWTDVLTSNFTYSENRVDNTPLQPATDLHLNTYLAVNLIWSPVERVYCGVEYLFGTRRNVDGGRGEANRVQMSFILELP
jgi:hypothetical protein